MQYEYEKGYYEYKDKEGYARIGYWEQCYRVDRIMDEIIRKDKIGIVDFYEDEDSDEYVDGRPDRRRECPHCLEYDFHVKLGARILKKGEPVPIDHDQFLQCYECGNVYGKHEIERLKTLKTDMKQHVSDNPFDTKKSIVVGIPKRNSEEGKLISARKRRERQRAHHKDHQIDEEMRRHGDRVKVVYDSDPR